MNRRRLLLSVLAAPFLAILPKKAVSPFERLVRAEAAKYPILDDKICCVHSGFDLHPFGTVTFRYPPHDPYRQAGLRGFGLREVNPGNPADTPKLMLKIARAFENQRIDDGQPLFSAIRGDSHLLGIPADSVELHGFGKRV